MNLKNISFKKLLTQGGLALATLLSRLLEGCIALASIVYKLLRYALKALWAVFILALLIIPYGIFRLYQGYKNRKKRSEKGTGTDSIYGATYSTAVGNGCGLNLISFTSNG